MAGAKYQLFPALPPAHESALRASIARFGVIVPVVKDQNGNIIDGHNRHRIATELHVDYKVDRVVVENEAEAKEMARTLNSDRRHLTEQQRKEVVAMLAAETVAVGREEVARHSPEAIAGALGVTAPTVRADIRELENASMLTRPGKTLGQDGKVRPTRRQPAADSITGGNPQATDRKLRKASNRKALTETARAVGWELNRLVEKVERIAADDRFASNAVQVAAHLRHHLLRSIETLTEVLDKLPHTKENGTP